MWFLERKVVLSLVANTIDNIFILQKIILFQEPPCEARFYGHYDRSWKDLWSSWMKFYHETLNQFEILDNMKNLIFQCLSSAYLYLNSNGSTTGNIGASRGVRQGNPLSPYLFVIGMEIPGHLIRDVVKVEDWIPFKFGRGHGYKLSHVCFADYIILVAETSPSQILRQIYPW